MARVCTGNRAMTDGLIIGRCSADVCTLVRQTKLKFLVDMTESADLTVYLHAVLFENDSH
jgi:hypothetical protein